MVHCVSLVLVDSTHPAPIKATPATPGAVAGTIDLTWTATGDDGTVGMATAYIVKYSTSFISTESEFNAPNTYAQSWSPSTAGMPESFTLPGFTTGQTYYFAIKVLDEVPNTSMMSNVASAQCP